MPAQPGGKVNAANLNFAGLNPLPTVVDADFVIVSPASGGPNRRAFVSQIGGGVPDPLLLGDGSDGAPTYSFLSAPTTGIFLTGPSDLRFSLAGAGQWKIINGFFTSIAGTGAALSTTTASNVVPVLLPRGNDADTGIGSVGLDNLSLIAGALEGLRIIESGGVTQATIPDGSETVPSFAFLNDLNTGIFSPLGDRLSITAGGIEVARFLEAGPGNPQAEFADGIVTDPSIAFIDDPNTGIFRIGSGEMGFVENGALVCSTTDLGRLQGASANSFSLLGQEDASGTNPTLAPDRTDTNTGIGHATVDQLNLIAGGLTCISIRETAGARQIGFYDGVPISLQTGVAVTTSAVHAALVALRLITA